MTLDPFLHQDAATRQAQLDAYLVFLERRDGEADVEARTLSARDAFFADLDARPVRSSIAIDEERFALALAGRCPPPSGSPTVDERRVWWLAAAAKANRGERYGVELALDLELGFDSGLPHDRYVPLEEVYHTRILLDACAVFGLEVEMTPPPRAMRALIALMERTPDRLRLPVVLAGEVVGSAIFQLLIDELAVFDADPTARARLQELLDTILVDEIGHVAYCRARIGRLGLAFARTILPQVAGAVCRDIPEVAWLAGGSRAFVDRACRFDVARDPALREVMFDPAVATSA